MTKINIDFQDISASEAEKRKIAEFKDMHEQSSPLETFKAIFFPTLALILAGSGIVLILFAIDPPYNFPEKTVQAIDDLPWTTNLIIALLALAFILWYRIHRSAKNSQLLDRQAKQQRG
jgi:uncharacterized membrane protein YqjE